MSLALEDIPQSFADFFDINLLSAQVILSIAVISALVLPTLLLGILAKSKGVALPLMMFFLAECLLVGLGWLSFWILLGTVAMFALAIAGIGTEAVTGG